jgi:hypothetical protein
MPKSQPKQYGILDLLLGIVGYFMFLALFGAISYRGVINLINEREDYQYMHRAGVQVEAEIIDLDAPLAYRFKNLRYRYQVLDWKGSPQTYEGEATLLGAKYQELESATTVSVLYDPSNHTHSRVKNHSEAGRDVLILGVGILGLSTLVMPFMVIVMYRLRKSRQSP